RVVCATIFSVRVSAMSGADYVILSTARRAPSCTLFPYTTLFRSRLTVMGKDPVGDEKGVVIAQQDMLDEAGRLVFSCLTRALVRSEEHTSELQSRENLVCRLLLEKKK